MRCTVRCRWMVLLRCFLDGAVMAPVETFGSFFSNVLAQLVNVFARQNLLFRSSWNTIRIASIWVAINLGPRQMNASCASKEKMQSLALLVPKVRARRQARRQARAAAYHRPTSAATVRLAHHTIRVRRCK